MRRRSEQAAPGDRSASAVRARVSATRSDNDVVARSGSVSRALLVGAPIGSSNAAGVAVGRPESARAHGVVASSTRVNISRNALTLARAVVPALRALDSIRRCRRTIRHSDVRTRLSGASLLTVFDTSQSLTKRVLQTLTLPSV